MRYLVTLRWRYRITENIKSQLDFVELANLYWMDAAILSWHMKEQFRQFPPSPTRKTDRVIWRDYSFLRFSDKRLHGVRTMTYDNTASAKALKYYNSLLWYRRQELRALMRLGPKELNKRHRFQVYRTPLGIPPKLRDLPHYEGRTRIRVPIPEFMTAPPQDEQPRAKVRAKGNRRTRAIVVGLIILGLVVWAWQSGFIGW